MNDADRTNSARRSARKRARKLGLSIASLTIAICGDEKTAKCSSACQMRESWKHLRAIAKSRRRQDQTLITVLRVSCPGICRFGPVAGVFPSGTWYGGCDPAVLDQIIDAHLKSDLPSADLNHHRIV